MRVTGLLDRRLLVLLLAWPAAAAAAEFRPDPLSVQRWGPAYRYPHAGWIVMHIEGQPYERGLQHGRLLAPEIAAYVRCLAASYGPKAPVAAWQHTRRLVGALLLPSYPEEQLAEMRGIVDGANGAGARFEGRTLDLLDIVVLNSVNEIESLDGALEAMPSGPEGVSVKRHQVDVESSAPAPAKRRARPMRCTAFAANGPATRDGKVVFGHVTMWELYPANFYNVWLDVQPAQGFRFVMQTTPGGTHSGMDYCLTDAGLLLSETTVEQTRLAPQGRSLGARIREATQYADSIERAAKVLSQNGNGLSTTEWILADIRRNEIALLTLGTQHHKLYRGSQQEWISGAAGFYWSCNNTKDREVRLEAVPSLAGRPSSSATFVPCKRDTIALRMYDQHRGEIDAGFCHRLQTTPEMVAAWAVDAKYTTADLAAQRKSWATFGPPVGAVWDPSPTEHHDYPEVKPLVSNPWVVLHHGEPAPESDSAIPVLDLHDPEDTELPPLPKRDQAPEPTPRTVWHGTLLPKTDADIWLTSAFSYYERIVALEKSLQEETEKKSLRPADLEQLGVELAYYRSQYELGARAGNDTPLAQTQANPRDENWYRVASGKGVLLLHALRGLLGAEQFDEQMDKFGRAHAGREVTVAEFQAHLERETGKRLQAFFDGWLNRSGLPRPKLGATEVRRAGKQWTTTVTVALKEAIGGAAVPVTVETSRGEVTATACAERSPDTITITTAGQPRRMIVDKYGLAAGGHGSPFTVLTFDSEIEQSLIVYGTVDEEDANRVAASRLQHALRRREHNAIAAIKSDREVSAEELRTHHVLLIGRPDSNRVVARFRTHLPGSFGPRSFVIRWQAYAHPETAVILATENPLNRRYSLVVVAGLGSLATLTTVPQFEDESLSYAPVVVLPHQQEERALVAPPSECVCELK